MKPWAEMNELERERERKRTRKYYRLNRAKVKASRLEGGKKWGFDLKQFWAAMPDDVRSRVASLKSKLVRRGTIGKEKVRRMMRECKDDPPQSVEEFDARYGLLEQDDRAKRTVEAIERSAKLFELPTE